MGIERKLVKRALLVGGAVMATGLFGLTVNHDGQYTDAYGQPLDAWGTPTFTPSAARTATATHTASATSAPTVDVPATVRAILTASAPTPDIPATVRAQLTSVASATPVVPTPDIAATVQAAVKTAIPTQIPGAPTPNLPALVREIMAALPTAAPAATPFVVEPQVVSPFVVKPEVVKVPEVIRVEIPVVITPSGDTITVDRKTLNALIDEGVKKGLTAEAKVATPSAIPLAPVYSPTPVSRGEYRGDGFRWDWGTALIAGALGLVIGAAAFYRGRVVQYVHDHYHPPAPPP